MWRMEIQNDPAQRQPTLTAQRQYTLNFSNGGANNFSGFTSHDVGNTRRHLGLVDNQDRRTRPNVLNPKSVLKLAVWNAQTLAAHGRLQQLADDLDHHNIDIACITEARRKGNGCMEVGNAGGRRLTMYYSGHEFHAVNGVAVVVSELARKSIVSKDFVNERIMTMRFQQTTGYLSLIVAYSPTNCERDIAKKDRFHEELTGVLDRIPKGDIVAVAGDFNGEVGTDRRGWEKTRGPFGSGTVNDNGNRLLNLASAFNLKVGNTFFRHKTCQQLTWHSQDRRTKKISDYLLFSSRHFSALQDVRVHNTTRLLTDHRLVVCQLKLHLKAQKTAPRPKKLDVKRLKLPRVQERLNAEISSQMVNLALPEDVDAGWDLLLGIMKTASDEIVGFTKRTRASDYISQVSLLIAEEKSATTDPAKRRELSKQLRRSLRKDERVHWNEIAGEMEKAHASGDAAALFATLKRVLGNHSGVSEDILDDNGRIITDPKKRLARWTSYFGELLNRPAPTLADADLEPAVAAASADDTISFEPPTNEEIRKIINKLKNNKSPGPDGLPAEFYKVATSAILPKIGELIRKAWNQGKTPRKWQESLIIPVHKKGSAKACANYRGISLLPLIGKIYTLLVLQRIGDFLDSTTSESQAGFRRNRSTKDNIFLLRQLLQRRSEFQKETIVAYLDYSAAFDSVDRNVLWRILLASGLPAFYVDRIRQMYEDAVAKVRVYGEIGAAFNVSSGVKQGDVLSPLLFLKAVDWVITHAFSADEDGVIVGDGFVVSSAEYADDIAVIGENLEKLQKHIDRIDSRSRCVGLRLNSKKCKYTASGPVDGVLLVNGEPIEKTSKFQYLGSMIDENADPEIEVNIRLGRAMGVFRSLSKCLWKRRQIPLCIKLRIFDSMVLSVLFYGIELLPLSANCTQRIASFESKCLRSMLGVSWTDNIANLEILNRCGRYISMEVRLQKMRLQWLGHLARMAPDRLARRSFFTSVPHDWKRRAGGQRKTWEKTVKCDTEKELATRQMRALSRNFGNSWQRTVENLAQDRAGWKTFIGRCGNNQTAA